MPESTINESRETHNARLLQRSPRRSDGDYGAELSKTRASHQAMLELEMAKAEAYWYFQKYQRAQ